MLDLKAIRDDPDFYRAAMARRGAAEDLEELIGLDARRRELTVRVEDFRAKQNKASKEIGRAQGDTKQALIDEVGQVSAALKAAEPELETIGAAVDALLGRMPNVADADAPDGESDEDNVLLKTVGEPTKFDGFEPRDHVDLGELLGVIDIERAVRTSGSRFAYLMGPIVLVQFALVRYVLDVLIAKGFVPVIPPVMVREDALFGTGFLPTGAEAIYEIPEDDLFLVGTSEVSLAAFHQNEILDAADLPLRYCGYSTCFRREAGTYGKDTRGMFRVHQFDKVEMFSFTSPEQSSAEHDFLVSIEEEIVKGLEIPYRAMNVCLGELGAPAAKKTDIEAWLPGQDTYRELTSCSNCTDYQGRRLNTRIRNDDGANIMAHTLNGTATAVGRTLIALLENRQQADGSVPMPAVLHPYLPENGRTLFPRE